MAEFGNGRRVKLVRKAADGTTEDMEFDADAIINKGEIDKDPVLAAERHDRGAAEADQLLAMPSPSRNTPHTQTDVFALRNKLRKWTVQLRQRWWLRAADAGGVRLRGRVMGIPAAACVHLDGADGDGWEDHRAGRRDLFRGVDLLPRDAGGADEKHRGSAPGRGAGG